MTEEKGLERINHYLEEARQRVLKSFECEWDDFDLVDQSTISIGLIEGLKAGINFAQEYYGHEVEELPEIKTNEENVL